MLKYNPICRCGHKKTSHTFRCYTCKRPGCRCKIFIPFKHPNT